MILGISDSAMLDRNFIKVIDGIAGCAKSSAIHNFFIKNNINYARLTSTHRLAEDAKNRYGMDVNTICSGLFDSPGGNFYHTMKCPPAETVVIDEFLQTNPRVIEWAERHVGECNIILTTDSRQMLAPESEEKMMKAYSRLLKNDFVISSNPTKSMRPRNKYTYEAYEEAYNSVNASSNVFDLYKKQYADLPEVYEYGSVYLCHTKEIEQYLYSKYSLRSRYDIDLVGKGDLAGKNIKDKTIYPVLPQCEIKGRARCWQASRIATPTRYQGSEVIQGQKCYFLVEENSVVGNREWYTVLSRMWDIKDLYVVVLDLPRNKNITSFNGLPIIEYTTATIEDVGRLELKEGKKGILHADKQAIAEIIKQEEEPEGYAYNPEKFIYDGRIVVPECEKSSGNSKTMASLIRKEGTFNYTFTPEIISILEEHGAKFPRISGVHLSTSEKRNDFDYSLDLKAAYPHILNNEVLPTGDRIERYHFDGGLDWYISKGENGSPIVAGLIPENALIMIPEADCEYAFTTSSQIGSKMGKWLHEMAHKSIEDKMKIKEIRYGYAEKQYLISHRKKCDNTIDAYILQKENTHSLLMCAVRSYLAAIIHKIRKEVYGGKWERGGIVVDALNFDTEEDIAELGNRIRKIIPDYDFRIYKGEKENIVYKTYYDEPCKKDIRNLRRYRK